MPYIKCLWKYKLHTSRMSVGVKRDRFSICSPIYLLRRRVALCLCTVCGICRLWCILHSIYRVCSN